MPPIESYKAWKEMRAAKIAARKERAGEAKEFEEKFYGAGGLKVLERDLHENCRDKSFVAEIMDLMNSREDWL